MQYLGYEVGARQTDGRNGYQPGTWEGYVETTRERTDDDWSSYSGGWPDRATAIAAARKIAEDMGAR